MTYLGISKVEVYSASESNEKKKNPDYQVAFGRSDNLLKQGFCLSNEQLWYLSDEFLPTSTWPIPHPNYAAKISLSIGCTGWYSLRVPSSETAYSASGSGFSGFEDGASQIAAHFENVDGDEENTQEFVLSHFKNGVWVESVVYYFSPVEEVSPSLVEQ